MAQIHSFISLYSTILPYSILFEREGSKERNREERIKYYRNLRELIKVYGSKSLVFIDESGFEEFEGSVCAFGPKEERKSMAKDQENGGKEKI